MNVRTSLKLIAIAALLLVGPYAAAQSNPGEGMDRFAYDVLTAGPQLGVAFRF